MDVLFAINPKGFPEPIAFFNRGNSCDCYYLIMPTRYYKNAPIAEAIVNIQYRQNGTFDCAAVRSLDKVFAERFPVVSPVHMVQFNVNSLESGEIEPIAPPKPAEVGIRLSNPQNDRVLQIHQGSFALSHLAPYSSWGQFRAEVKSLWEAFVLNYCEVTVTRCSLRFINKITIPHPSVEMSDYFHLYPQVPKGIPQDISGMLLQLQMPQDDIASTAVVNLALAQPELPDHLTVVLDIELMAERLELKANSDEIWNTLDLARNRKNELFESFITDETRKLIS